MRGTLDDAIEELTDPTTGKRRKEVRERSPGGKPLLRKLQLLVSAGLADAADESIGLAVADEARPQVLEHAARSGIAPPSPNGDAATDTRTRTRATKKRADAAVAAGELGQLYLEVGERLAGPPTPIGPQWRSLGPWTVPNGQTYGSSRVNVSGRVSAIAIDPLDPAHVLVGAANGGVWESRNRGASWTPRTDYAATLTVGAIAFDPSAPSTVYCGTGEGNWWSWLGAGVLRSTNGGATWSTLCTAPFVGQGFYELIVDPADGQHLIAATTGGVYVSTDGGATWARRRTTVTWSLSLSPTRIFAASGDGLWRSTDGGSTWTAVSLPGSPGSFNRLAVSVAPSSPGIVYVWGALGATAYLWRRAAGSWTSAPPPPGVSTGQAWYDWFVAAAPDRGNQVYVGAIETYRADISAGSWTWRNLSNKGGSGDSIHPDQHAIAFEPGTPDTIYVGNDGGLYRSPDRGTTWVHCNNGLVISEFEYLAQNVGSSRWLLGGTQDNGTERWRGSPVWDHVADGDGGDVGVNRTTPTTVFHTYYGMSLERSTSSGDWGSWTWISPGGNGLFYPPFECSATNGETIGFAGTLLNVSRNSGTAWTTLGYPSAATGRAMYIPNADNVYVGTTDGHVFRTQWNGVGWTPVAGLPSSMPRPGGGSISDLFVDPNNLNRIWVTYTTIGGGRVYRSDDGGATWIDRTAGLPGLPINAIDVDPWNANRAWVAADLGVYQTLDGGTTWTDFANGLPNAYVGDVVFHPNARVLRAGTRNRGVWEIPVDGWMTQPVCGVQWVGSLAGNQQQRWFTFRWPATWHVVWTVMPTTPRPGAPQIWWDVAVERASAEFVTYWITVRNLTPDPLSFEGRYCILSRY